MATAGNTATLVFAFVGGDGEPASPSSDVTVRIYDAQGRQIGDDDTIPQAGFVSTGVYHYPYLVPTAKPQAQEAFFYYEGSATVGGEVQTGRRREPIEWAKQR